MEGPRPGIWACAWHGAPKSWIGDCGTALDGRGAVAALAASLCRLVSPARLAYPGGMTVTARRMSRLLVALAAIVVVFLGTATWWSVEAERGRVADERRSTTREALADAAGLIRSDLDERMGRALAAGRELLESGAASRWELVSEDAPLIVVFDAQGRLVVPSVAPLLRFEELLRRARGGSGESLQVALKLTAEGSPAAARSYLERASGQREDPGVRDVARYFLATEALREGLRNEGLELLRSLVSGDARLPTGQRYQALRTLLEDALTRRDGERVTALLEQIDTDLFPVAASPEGSVVTAWLAELPPLLAAVYPREGSDLEVRLQRATLQRQRLAALPEGGPPLLGRSGIEGVVRIPVGDRLAAAMQVTSENGTLRGTVVVLPPRRVSEAVAAGSLGGIRERGYDVVIEAASKPIPDALVARVGGYVPDLALVALPGDHSGPWPWRSVLSASFLLGCCALVGAGVVLVLRGIRREEELLSSRSEFLATVAHQLKTPVANLRLFAETLASGRVAREDDRNRMQEILRIESTKLGDHLEQILSLERMDQPSASDPAPERIDVGAALRALEVPWRRAAELRDCRLTLEVQEDLPAALGDPRALSDACHNVVANAIKYTAADSVVTVRAAAEGERLWIQVVDRGPGIAARDRDRVFDRFFRGAEERSRGDAGTGLGLAIAREGAARCGGTVRIESTGPEGSVMTIELPVMPHDAERGKDDGDHPGG